MSKKVMVNGEEFEIEEETHPVAEHFKQPISQIELAKKLARYRELATEIEILEEAKERLRKELLEAGKGMESITAGDYAAFFTKVRGTAKTDWKQAYKDAVGEMPEDEVSKYIKRSEDYIKMEVKKIR